MALSISDILRDLDPNSQLEQAPESATSHVKVAEEAPSVEKVALYLESLASPDSVVDELAKLAVLQDWVEAQRIPMHKLAEANLEVRDDERITMMKSASLMIRDLQSQVNELTEKTELRKMAENIAKRMQNSGHISHDEVLDKVAELAEQSRDELTTLNKALDFAKTAGGLGSLSDNRNDTDNPLLDFLLT